MSCDTVTFYIKKGDRLPYLEHVLSDENGLIDLSVVSSVALKMKLASTIKTVSASVLSIEESKVRATWGATDTDTVGSWDAEWVLTIGGNERTVPSNGFFKVVVTQDIS